ncbi:hypothetical protein ACVFYP_15880 [Roseomonas sp. F4]
MRSASRPRPARLAAHAPHPGAGGAAGGDRRVEDWLGLRLFERRNNLQIDEVFAGLPAVILIGLVVEGAIFRVLEARTLRRWGMQR